MVRNERKRVKYRVGDFFTAPSHENYKFNLSVIIFIALVVIGIREKVINSYILSTKIQLSDVWGSYDCI